MRVRGQRTVWALGDCAVVPNAKDGKPSPTLAQFALRQARQLATNLKLELAGQPTRPFSFRMLGSFAAIGHHNAVGDVLGVRLSGILAWVMWRAIYLGKMQTLARKVQIAFDWAWELFFSRDIVELSPRATGRVPRAHYELGNYVFRQGDFADNVPGSDAPGYDSARRGGRTVPGGQWRHPHRRGRPRLAAGPLLGRGPGRPPAARGAFVRDLTDAGRRHCRVAAPAGKRPECCGGSVTI
jgi:hypothetical protein